MMACNHLQSTLNATEKLDTIVRLSSERLTELQEENEMIKEQLRQTHEDLRAAKAETSSAKMLIAELQTDNCNKGKRIRDLAQKNVTEKKQRTELHHKMSTMLKDMPVVSDEEVGND